MNKHFLPVLRPAAALLSGLASCAVLAASIMDQAAPAHAYSDQAPSAATESAEPAKVPLQEHAAGSALETDLDRIIAVVNNEVITEQELMQRVHTVAINLRRQQIDLPPMQQLRAQVLERLISERTILQRARATGIRVDDQMVNAAIEQIARQNNLTIEELRQRLAADGVAFNAFRNEIRDEITTQRLREREVDAKIDIPESEVDAYLAEKAGFTSNDTTEWHVAHILLPINHPDDESKMEAEAESIAERARAGEDFSKLVASYSRSDDALQGGDLGWKTRQDLPTVFWDVMKDNARTGGVYIAHSKRAVHVVKILGQRDGVEAKLSGGPVVQTHARHILMFVSDITPEADVLRRLHDIKARVKAGDADFASMARLHSVDTTATRGGDLGWLQPGDTVPEFEAAMNSLKPGEVSEPIKTNYGYHLIQVVERRTDKSGNPQRMRVEARQALRQRKLAEAAYNWQRELRDEAYVEIRDPDLQ